MPISAMLARKLDKVKEAKQAYEDQLKNFGEDSLREIFVDAFNDHPELGGVVWTQYVAEYDDNSYTGGDKVNEPYALIPIGVAKGFSIFRHTRTFEIGDKTYSAINVNVLRQHMPAITNHLEMIWENVLAIEPVLRSTLGEGLVTVTREGFETDYSENQEIHDWNNEEG